VNPVQEEQAWGRTPDRWINQMAENCKRLPLHMVGKGVFKEEFVAAGGVRLDEVNLKTLESLRSPGLFLAGEILDVDGLTGGFNLQSAWATGWVAGEGMAH
jgi:predicted flavoprotein YhiN